MYTLKECSGSFEDVSVNNMVYGRPVRTPSEPGIVPSESVLNGDALYIVVII